jgi:endonuclease YncB( thermonuclease family)
LPGDFGQGSKRHLSALVFGKEVEAFGSKLDRYGRYVGTVVIDGTDANLEQLRAGMAWYYREYAADVPAAKRAALCASRGRGSRSEARSMARSKRAPTEEGVQYSTTRSVAATGSHLCAACFVAGPELP